MPRVMHSIVIFYIGSNLEVVPSLSIGGMDEVMSACHVIQY